jgi:glyoxylase-like metal-dependent hydrolase (beta-lactamase superfamily II)
MTNPTIHVYRSAERGIFVNSFFVEGSDAVVAVDAPLLRSDARAFRARLDALGKPLAGVLINHPHPDHYNGVTELVEGHSVPIVALADVDVEIRARDGEKRAQWGPMFGDEWPSSATFPTEHAKDCEVVELGGLAFTPIDLGAGESVSETLWRLTADRPVAFTGDLVFAGVHPYVADGHTAAWIESLDRAKQLLDPTTVLYIGHGGPSVGIGALQEQKAYLLMLREVIRRLSAGADHLEPAAKEELQRIMWEFLPDAPLAWLLGAGCDAVAAELSRVAAAGPIG